MKIEIDFKAVFDDLVIEAICTGDQVLWNYLYPRIKKVGYEIDKNIIKHFSAELNTDIQEEE